MKKKKKNQNIMPSVPATFPYLLQLCQDLSSSPVTYGCVTLAA